MTYDVYYNNKINMACGFNTDQCLYDLGFHHMEASFSPEGPKSFLFLLLIPLHINSRPMHGLYL